MPIVDGKWAREYEIRGSLSTLDDKEGIDTPVKVLAGSFHELCDRVKMFAGPNDWLEIRAPSGETKRWATEGGKPKSIRDDFNKEPHA